MKYESTLNDGVLTISLDGHIDSGNAPEIEKSINEIMDGKSFDSLVLDAEKLTYISSAGLRIFLRLLKKVGNLKVINATPEVYEILEMTGFTEMMPVEKAYRSLDVEGCEMIGQGANGIVYRYDPEIIVKVYRNPDALPEIHRERDLAHKAFVLGIPTAIPFDVVKVGNGYGSVFELLNADYFAKLIKANPESVEQYADMAVKLLHQIHSTHVKPGDMPNMKEVAIDWVKFLQPYLPEDKYNKLLFLVEAVPERDTMLHGDYHVKNLMVQNGEVLLIDMDTLCTGHPIFEFASIFNAYIGYTEMEEGDFNEFLGMPTKACHIMWDESVNRYFPDKTEEEKDEIRKKSMLMGYTRVLRRTIRRKDMNDPAVKREVDHYRNVLCSLIDQVDSLDF